MNLAMSIVMTTILRNIVAWLEHMQDFIQRHPIMHPYVFFFMYPSYIAVPLLFIFTLLFFFCVITNLN